MEKVFVLADDFTGALDTGVQFAVSGSRVLVTTAEHAGKGVFEGNCDVLVIDSESRHIPPEKAAALVAALTDEAVKHGFTYYYKKTDSALRGNIGAELDAMLKTNGGKTLVFVPAYPKNGRVTVGGIQYIDGIPLSKSIFAQDPFRPVKYDEVTHIVNEQTDIEVVNYPTDIYRKYSTRAPSMPSVPSVPSVLKDMNGFNGADKRVIEVYDVESDDDFILLGRFLKVQGKLKTLAGCAGFAGILPDLFEMVVNTHSDRLSSSQACICKNNTARRDLLLVTGSVNPITFGQLANAANSGFHIITLTPEQKLNLTPEAADEITAAAIAVLSGNDNGQRNDRGRVIIAAAINQDDIKRTDEYAQSHGISTKDLRNLICSNIGRLIKNILKRHIVYALAVFGGDTLYEILTQADIHTIIPVREITPGIVEAKILSGHHNLRLITKSGGLGGESAINDITDYLFH